MWRSDEEVEFNIDEVSLLKVKMKWKYRSKRKTLFTVKIKLNITPRSASLRTVKLGRCEGSAP